MEAKNIKKTANMQGWHPNTHLCVDVRTLLRNDLQAMPGREYQGWIKRDQEDHFTFVEMPPSTACKRNPHVYVGKYITITRQDDGTLRPNFKNLVVDEDFSVERYAFGVYNELCMALGGLIEER